MFEYLKSRLFGEKTVEPDTSAPTPPIEEIKLDDEHKSKVLASILFEIDENDGVGMFVNTDQVTEENVKKIARLVAYMYDEVTKINLLATIDEGLVGDGDRKMLEVFYGEIEKIILETLAPKIEKNQSIKKRKKAKDAPCIKPTDIFRKGRQENG